MLKTLFTKPVIMITSALVLLIMSCSCGSSTQMPQYARTPSQMAHINNGVVALVAPRVLLGNASPASEPEERSVNVEDLTDEEAQSLTYRIYCTGAFIGEGLVLTAYHCVDTLHEEGRRVHIGTYDDYIETQATFRHRRWRYFDIAASDPANDLAILRLSSGESRIEEYEVLDLANNEPRNGEFVFSLGHPRGLGWTLTYGVVSQATRVGNAATPGNDETTIYVQSSAQAFFGNSGGPLMNSDNEIIGVVSRGGPWHIVMSVHLRMIRSFLCNTDLSTLSQCSYFLSAGPETHRAYEMTVLGHQR